MHRATKKLLSAASLALVAPLALTACAESGSGPSTATGEPIIVASVNSLSGAGTFAEASAAAKAVFDEYNANGGLDGRPIQYTAFDDKGDPTTASSSAREAVESGAVAMVGGASVLDCEVNHAYYAQNGIMSIQGTGVDPFCFTTPNISPVNTGPYVDTTLTLVYGSEQLGLERICGFVAIAGSTREAYQEAIDAWTAQTGKELVLLDDTLTYETADYTPYVIKAKQAGCDGIYSNAIEPGYIGLMNAAEAQGLNDMTFLFLTSGYSQQFAEATTFTGQGIHVPAEFLPFSDESLEGNAEWRALMEQHNVPLTAFAQGGYLAAKHFIQVLESMDGDITRENVTAALQGMTEPIETPMTGTPWIFGPGDRHGSNTAGWPIAILPGTNEWASVADDWMLLAD